MSCAPTGLHHGEAAGRRIDHDVPLAGHGGDQFRLETDRLAMGVAAARHPFAPNIGNVVHGPHPPWPVSGTSAGRPGTRPADGSGSPCPCAACPMSADPPFPAQFPQARAQCPCTGGTCRSRGTDGRWASGIDQCRPQSARWGPQPSGAGRRRPIRGACGFRAPADYKADINIPAPRTACVTRGLWTVRNVPVRDPNDP